MLDTWFSSALWPFATLGWPERDADDLKRSIPGDLQTTAREIIRLWENRMIFSGLELLGEMPFRDVIIHSTVLAPDGRRMSKSLGTGIDPLDDHRAARHRRDAVRPAQELADAGRALLLLGDRGGRQAREQAVERGAADPETRARGPARRGRRRSRSAGSSRGSRRHSARTRAYVAEFDFAHAVDELYHLTFDDFCDWYLEAVKQRLYDGDDDARDDRRRRARAAAEAAAPGDAARHRGDLVAPARPGDRG